MGNMPFAPPPGLIGDDTVFSAPGRWRNSSMVRFWQGSWQVRGGWERLSLENLGGVCRAVMGWQDASDVQGIAFGLHNGLKVWQDSTIFDITPVNPAPVALGANPLSTIIGSRIVGVVIPAHGLVTGDHVELSGLAVTGGLDLNAVWHVDSVTGVNSITILHNVAATATVAAGGGAAGFAQHLLFKPGEIDGTGGAGYSTGAYGIGTYGTPSTADYFPLTWSLSPWGQNLMANPRGQGIFYWDGLTAFPAERIPTAPVNCTYMLVNPQRQVMAFGCNEEVSGEFNPLAIRWSDIENFDDWATLSSNNAGEWILESGGRIVCARLIGDYVLVWTLDAVFLGTFIGDPGQTWKFDKVGANCGAIGPGAPVVRAQTATWIAPDKMFWTYNLGGAPSQVACPIRGMFEDYMTLGQNDKIMGATVGGFGETTWFYPDSRDGFENSRALTLGAEGWSRDLLSRSAFVDAGPHTYPIGVSPDGWAYWHEKGHSSDGAPLSGFIESADFYMGEGDGGVMVNGVWPDLKGQIGVFRLSIFGREYPQARERTFGPWNLQPGQSKRSFRKAMRIARVRLDFGSAPCYARGGKPEFDVQAIGGR